MKIIYTTLLFIVFFLSFSSQSKPQYFSVHFQEMTLQAVIGTLARCLHMNVVISPSVSGTITLEVEKVSPRTLFNLILFSHHLGVLHENNVWYIAPQAELIRQKEEEDKWKQAQEHLLPVVTKTWQIHYAKAADIVHLLKGDENLNTSSKEQIGVDSRTNLIILQGNIKRLKVAESLIRRLDIPVKQILIEARLVNIDHDFERELGFSFNERYQTKQNNNLTSHDKHQSEEGHYTIALARLANDVLLDIKLAALERKGVANLISSPSLFTANQQVASIEAGEEVPYQEVSESGGTAIAFKKAVLSLKVTPHILPHNKILLQLQINQDRPTSRSVLGVPTISTRQITTNVRIANGQTIVLGGIYEANEEYRVNQPPLISDLPIIGSLLQHKKTNRTKRELLIFVTPKVIKE